MAVKIPALFPRSRWMRLLSTSALFSIVTAVALVAFESNSSNAPSPPAPAPAAIEPPLGLKVTRQKEQVEIRWNNAAIGPLGGYKAQMKISEGETTAIVRLDWRDLADGHISYTPMTNDVRIVFELIKADGSIIRESAHASGFFDKR